MLTTEPNAEVGGCPSQGDAGDPDRSTEEWATWLTAPWAEAKALQRQLPYGSLRIVARGEKEDALPV